MEFVLNNKKYSIINHELFLDYLIVDSYFRKNYSKYDYNIEFDFITPLLEKEKIEFSDIEEGAELLDELIEKEELNFIVSGLDIDQHVNGNFRISYQDIILKNITIVETIPVLIALHSLVNANPIVSIEQIKEEIEFFIEKFRNFKN